MKEFKTNISDKTKKHLKYSKDLDIVKDKVSKSILCIEDKRKVCDGCGNCCEE